jgi:hypothetical protein
MNKDCRNKFIKIMEPNQASRDSYTLINMSGNTCQSPNNQDSTQILTFRSNFNCLNHPNLNDI